jgi:uncharacterized cofD-like protein
LDPDRALRVVAIGGGTGLAALLRALKLEAGRAREPWQVTGIVAVSDNGGSSGRLRAELGTIPPGDLRNCLGAMSQEDSVLADLLNYRFRGDGSLAGHSLGNLMLLALADLTGDWVRAIRQLSGVLVTVGRLYPATTVPVTLHAEDFDGNRYEGETAVNESRPPLARLWLEPREPEPLPDAVLAILRADLVVLAPGSLYTSTIPNLLIREIRDALLTGTAPIVYVANLMTEPGESAGLDLPDHAAAIQAFGRIGIRAILANSEPLAEPVLHRYLEEGGAPIDAAAPDCLGIPVFAMPVLDPESQVARHHPTLLRQALRTVIAAL